MELYNIFLLYMDKHMHALYTHARTLHTCTKSFRFYICEVANVWWLVHIFLESKALRLHEFINLKFHAFS